MTSPTFAQTIPILRIFDVAKAREFYLDFLGFTLDWEHRFEPDLPVYMQVSRGGLVLHLSEHTAIAARARRCSCACRASTNCIAS